MKFSYNWLQGYFKNKLPFPAKLAEILTRHSFEVEKVSKAGKDWVLDIDVLPNRTHDCLSHIGIARECAALLNTKFQIPKYKIQNTKYKIQDYLKVEVKDKDLCSRYCARVISGIKVGPSPKWLKERLEIIGQKSINNIVDATNYVMFEIGQPLHAFDFDRISPVIASERSERGNPVEYHGIASSPTAPRNDIKKIIVRRAKKNEKITTLEGEEYELDENILVIADSKEPIAIAGLKGGQKAGITQETKNIILEAANFNPQNIRRVSKKLGLRTESSLRFEAGLDANLASEAIERLAGLIQKIANGKIVSGLIDIYPQKIKPKKIKLEIEKVKRLLGIEIPAKEIKSILERLGCEVEGDRPLGRDKRSLPKGRAPGRTPEVCLEVIVPTRRLDITLPEDLIEEIGRIFGYEKIPAQLPSAVLIPPERNESLIYENKIRDILVSAGLSEVYNYSFVSEKQVFGSLSLKITRLVELENPVSQEQKYLRPNLLFNLLKNIKDNLRFFDEIGLFEIGKVFYECHSERSEESRGKKSATGFLANARNDVSCREEKKLAGIFALKSKSEEPREFYQLKGVVDSLLNKLRISDVWYDDAVNKQQTTNNKQLYHSIRRAEIKIGDDSIGWLGEINQEILEKSSIKTRAAGFEIDFERLVKLAAEEQIYRPPSKYPAVVRDIAVLVEPSTKVEEVLNLIETAGGPLVQDVDLFDIYEGEEIPEGKKNLAFHIIYQAEDRTLTDKEVNDIQAKIIRTLEHEGGWEVRK